MRTGEIFRIRPPRRPAGGALQNFETGPRDLIKSDGSKRRLQLDSPRRELQNPFFRVKIDPVLRPLRSDSTGNDSCRRLAFAGRVGTFSQYAASPSGIAVFNQFETLPKCLPCQKDEKIRKHLKNDKK